MKWCHGGAFRVTRLCVVFHSLMGGLLSQKGSNKEFGIPLSLVWINSLTNSHIARDLIPRDSHVTSPCAAKDKTRELIFFNNASPLAEIQVKVCAQPMRDGVTFVTMFFIDWTQT